MPMYDREPIKMTEEYRVAMERLLVATCNMMKEAEPENAECWTWGRAYVKDLAFDKIAFRYGGEDDMPNDGHGHFAVIDCEKGEP